MKEICPLRRPTGLIRPTNHLWTTISAHKRSESHQTVIGENEDEGIMICARSGVIAELREKSSESHQQLFPHHLSSSVTFREPPGSPQEIQPSKWISVLLQKFNETAVLIKRNNGWDWMQLLWKEMGRGVWKTDVACGAQMLQNVSPPSRSMTATPGAQCQHPNKHEYDD